MSEEKINQELSDDELKDVAGGLKVQIGDAAVMKTKHDTEKHLRKGDLLGKEEKPGITGMPKTPATGI